MSTEKTPATAEEIAAAFREMKKQVTSLGYRYLSDKLPIEISRFEKEMQPFILLENSFEKAIIQLKKQIK